MGRLLDVKREFAKGEEVFWGIDGSSALCIGFFGGSGPTIYSHHHYHNYDILPKIDHVIDVIADLKSRHLHLRQPCFLLNLHLLESQTQPVTEVILWNPPWHVFQSSSWMIQISSIHLCKQLQTLKRLRFCWWFISFCEKFLIFDPWMAVGRLLDKMGIVFT